MLDIITAIPKFFGMVVFGAASVGCLATVVRYGMPPSESRKDLATRSLHRAEYIRVVTFGAVVLMGAIMMGMVYLGLPLAVILPLAAVAGIFTLAGVSLSRLVASRPHVEKAS